MSTMEEILRPPTEAEVTKALALFADAIRGAYGDRLAALYLFGSRARGDHEPHSDADVAVVLVDEDWRYMPEKMRLADLACDVIVETGVHVQGWPVSGKTWRDPAKHHNPGLIRNMKRDARAMP